MKFLYSCLINKNTLELRKKLENLGYKLKGKFKDFSFIYCKNGYYSTPSVNEKPPKDYYIDCGTNEELFLAIAALRDDSDINQWFVYNNTDWENEEDLKEITFFLCKEKNVKSEMCCNLLYNDCRKATVEELIKHFTKE